mgnify:CR=1 FL=1
MILSTLAKKGANPFHPAQAMKSLGMLKDDTKAACKEAILKAQWQEAAKLELCTSIASLYTDKPPRVPIQVW